MNIVNTGNTIRDWILNAGAYHQSKVDFVPEKSYNKDNNGKKKEIISLRSNQKKNKQ